MDLNIKKGFTLFLISLFAITIAACSSDDDTTPQIEVDDSDNTQATESETETSNAQEAEESVDSTIDEDIISEDDSDVEIGELI